MVCTVAANQKDGPAADVIDINMFRVSRDIIGLNAASVNGIIESVQNGFLPVYPAEADAAVRCRNRY